MIYLLLTFDVPNSYNTAPKDNSEIRTLLHRCYDLLDQIERSRATWFVDEFGYRLTEGIPDELCLMSQYGEVALHAHLNLPPHGTRERIPDSYDLVMTQIENGYQRLKNFLVNQSLQDGLFSIRAGSFLTNNVFYQSMANIGLINDSSVPAYHSARTMTVGQMVRKQFLGKLHIINDQRRYLNSGTQPYFFKPEQPLISNGNGRLLEVPVHIYTRMLERGFKLEELVKIQMSKKARANQFFLNFAMHPYEFSNFGLFATFLQRFREMEAVQFVTARKVRSLLDSTGLSSEKA
jgi:hypothetical protein